MNINLLKRYRFRRLFFICMLGCLSSFMVFSCFNKDDYDFKKIAELKWEPEYAFPLTYTNLTINDLLATADTSEVRTNANGLLYFFYQDTIQSFVIPNLVNLPVMTHNNTYNFPLVPLPAINHSITKQIRILTGLNGNLNPFPAIPPSQTPNSNPFILNGFKWIDLSSGNLSLKVTNNTEAPLSMDVELLNANIVVGTFNFTLVPANGGAQTVSLPVSGKTIQNNMEIKILNVSSPGSAGKYKQNDEVLFELNGVGLDYTQAEILFQEEVSINSTQLISMAMNPEKLKEIMLKSGLLTYRISSNALENLEYSFSFSTFSKSGNIIYKAGNVASSGIVASLDMADYKLGLDLATPFYNIFPVTNYATLGKKGLYYKIKRNNSVTFDYELKNLDYVYVKGSIGNRNLPFGGISISLPPFKNSFKGSTLLFDSATIKVNVSNECGLPIKLDFHKIYGKKPNDSILVLLSPSNPVMLKYPSTLDGPAEITQISAANAKEVYSFAPEQVYFLANMELNPEPSTAENLLKKQSKITVEMIAELPMIGVVENIKLADTVEIDLKNKVIDIKKALMRASILNDFPLDGFLQVYMLNEQDQLIGALLDVDKNKLIRSANLDSNGNSISPSDYTEDFIIENTKFDQLLECKKLMIEITLNTPRDSNGNLIPVKIKAGYKIDVKIGLQTKFTLSFK